MESEKLLAIALLLFSLFVFGTSFLLPAHSLGSGVAGPTFFPQIWSFILAVLSIILFIKSKKGLNSSGNWLLEIIRENKKVLYMLFIALTYIFLLNKIGFMVTTLLFLIISIYILDSAKKLSKLKILGISIVISLSTYLIFSKVLKVFLPTGILL